jgi:predicted transcriptional regulator
LKSQQVSEPTSRPAADGRLPDAELEVVASLWQRGEATAREIREAMAAYRPMTHGSMVTLLKRLEAKGWVARQKGPVGKAFVYHATRRPGPTQRRILRDLVRRIFGGNGVKLVATLLNSEPPTTEELNQLQHLFDELREKREGAEKDGNTE